VIYVTQTDGVRKQIAEKYSHLKTGVTKQMTYPRIDILYLKQGIDKASK